MRSCGNRLSKRGGCSMSEWLQTYNELFGMYNAGNHNSVYSVLSAVTFTVIFCWPKLVKDFGAKRRIYCGRLNYRNILAGESQIARFRFLHRFSYRCKRITHAIQPHSSRNPRKCPWVDMGWAIAMGFVVCDTLCAPKGKRLGLLKEAFPRWAVIIAGGG